jgi:DNA-binding response OmpR family regulator
MTRIVACGHWSPERSVALDALRAAGLVVETCGGGIGPLECIVQRPPDVLLFGVDEERPWESGALTLVRRLHPLLPLVVVTSDGSVEERLRLASVRPAYVAMDPIEPAELLDAIHALVGRDMRKASHLSRWRRAPRIGHGRPAG